MTNQPTRVDSNAAPDLPERLFSAARTGGLALPALQRALRQVGYTRSLADWTTFLNTLLLYLGALLLVSGVFFFFAYNWSDLHHFAKFGLVQAGIVGAAGLAHYLGLDKLSGKVSLTVAALLVGVLLAVYGQFYQTGADSYLLFLLWSLLIVGWVLIGKFQPLWFVFIALCNVTAFLFFEQTQGLSDDGFYQVTELLFLLNAGFLLLWEIARRRTMDWMENRSLPNVMGLVALVVITFPVAFTIMQIGSQYASIDDAHAIITALLYAATITAIFIIYGRIKHDLFMLTIAMFSLIALFITAMIQVLETANLDGPIALIVMGLVVVGLAGLAINLLQRISNSWETTSRGTTT